MIFGLPELIEFLSSATLPAGTVIAAGTPFGVGFFSAAFCL